MATKQARAIIRDEAARVGVRYRITAADEVEYYGDFPNTQGTGQHGWYRVANTSEGFARQILKELEHELDRKAGKL